MLNLCVCICASLSLSLQNYQSLSSTSVTTDVPTNYIPPVQYFKHVTELVSELRESLEELIQRACSNISTTGESVKTSDYPHGFRHCLEKKVPLWKLFKLMTIKDNVV